MPRTRMGKGYQSPVASRQSPVGANPSRYNRRMRGTGGNGEQTQLEDSPRASPRLRASVLGRCCCALRLSGSVLSVLSVLSLATVSGCSTSSSPQSAAHFSQKLVILGFDGMDPSLVRRWMDEGRLPNMAKLVARGGLYPL